MEQVKEEEEEASVASYRIEEHFAWMLHWDKGLQIVAILLHLLSPPPPLTGFPHPFPLYFWPCSWWWRLSWEVFSNYNMIMDSRVAGVVWLKKDLQEEDTRTDTGTEGSQRNGTDADCWVFVAQWHEIWLKFIWDNKNTKHNGKGLYIPCPLTISVFRPESHQRRRG